MPPLSIKKLTLDQRIAQAGGPAPLTVMFVCGDMMRRSSHPSSARPEETERALAALSVGAAVEALSSVDVASAKGELARALSESFEAAFADDEPERELFASSAMKALSARDQVASALVAAKARLALAKSQVSSDTGPLVEAIEAIEQRVAEVDREMSSKARSLTGINRERRAELAKLDEAERAAAWWYCSRSDEGDDGLLVALGGADGQRLGESARGDLAASDLGPSASLERSSLRRAAHGRASAAELGYLRGRAAKSEDIKVALDLVSDPSIEEAAE